MAVYSACQFYNELDILEARLNILDPVVDYHIITESNITWSGIPKPFYFNENKERFAKFLPKIIHQMHNNLPEDYVNLTPSMGKNERESFLIERVMKGDWWPHNHAPYGRDTYEKESVYLCMENCKDDDFIIISDLDEIPDPFVVGLLISPSYINQIYNFNHRVFYYYMNIEKVLREPGAIMLSYENFKKNSFCELKMKRRGVTLEECGWHFSYMGGAENIKNKIEAYSEYYLNTEHVKSNIQSNIDNCLISGKDLYFRDCEFKVAPVDSLPGFIVNHQNDIYSKYIRKI